MNDKARLLIYTITSLFIKNVKNENREVVGQSIESGHCRMVGFYADLQTAMKCVEEDWAGFDEAGYYNYIVIERMVEGLYNISGFDLAKPSEWWYRHDYEARKWVPCEKPKCLVGTVSFGMG